ncbi:MAG: ATP-dependent sacrificial sulfur transferase LarE [Spirochaetes bacterium]|mgnify:CR=1 FL=1|nr:MAG: ATP-dependent sacrificial sulfur transferase LarE [Spirochaetota bacterium]
MKTDTKTLEEKINRAREIIRKTGGCVVAYSGGVDSTLVLELAVSELNGRVIAVIAESPAYPKRERTHALHWVQSRGIPYRVIKSYELKNVNFRQNPPERCYYCKKELFSQMLEVAKEAGYNYVIDGTNADDEGDWRPGIKAASELGIISPLKEAGLRKPEIREACRRHVNAEIANKPSMACLASRFPYGEEINEHKLSMIEKIEDFLSSEGFSNFRARYHQTVLRIEVPADEIGRLIEEPLRSELIGLARECGFRYVTADLEGFQSGSMNRLLEKDT